MSAGEKKHDYHLSRSKSLANLYIFCNISFSCWINLLFHSKVMWAMIIGLALVCYGAFMWFRDVVIEAEHKAIIHQLFKFTIDME